MLLEPIDPNERFRQRRRQSRRRRSMRKVLALAVVALAAAASALGMTFLNGWGGKAAPTSEATSPSSANGPATSTPQPAPLPDEIRGVHVTAALASLAWAVSTVLVKPPLSEMDAVTAQAIRLPLAAVALAPFARSAPRALALTSRGARVRIAVLGALTSVSSVMFVAGVKHAGVAVASVLSSTAPMFAIPLAVVFLGERLTARALLGAAVTVAGIVVLQR